MQPPSAPGAPGAPGSPVGASGNGDETGCGSIEKTSEVHEYVSDVVLILDTSLSMADEICRVSENLTSFADGIGQDVRVVAIYSMGLLGAAAAVACGNSDPLAATDLAKDTSRYLHVDWEVGSQDALGALLATYPGYSGFLRPNGVTHFVVVTDDESLVPGILFKPTMESALGHEFILHAIVSDGSCLGAAGTGTQYLDLATQTGGQKLSICAEDWDALFRELKAAVVEAEPLPCTFEIPPPPAGEVLDPELVQVNFQPPGGTKNELPKAAEGARCEDKQGWFYDDNDNPTRIDLCPASCAATEGGGTIGVAFGCEPTLVF